MQSERPRRAATVDASVVIPVNAAADLAVVEGILADLAQYDGLRRIETLLVINNYLPDRPPPELADFRERGIRTVARPDVRRVGEPPGFTARMVGVRHASSQRVLLFDADCRIPWPTALLDHYVEVLAAGAHVAYTHVDYYDFDPALSVRARIAAHHAARWGKRRVLELPTTRGSNYAVDAPTVLALYDAGLLVDEMTVGPTVRRHGGRVAYSADRRLVVLTSGRVFRAGWRRLATYLRRRIVYNARVLSATGDAHSRTRHVRRAYPSPPDPEQQRGPGEG